MTEGAEFFDRERALEIYRAGRHRPDGPNQTLEKPVISELIGSVKGKHILDLGCGDAAFGAELLAAGCQSYQGLDASQQLVQEARRNLHAGSANIIHAKIEDWDYPVERYDLIISRLALHYVLDLDNTFEQVYKSLKPAGQFVFSIVHPVITSSDKSRAGGGIRYDWIVDDYFSSGPRKVYFMGEYVRQYHRTIESLFRSLLNAHFEIEQLREASPQLEHFEDEKLFERRQRIPLFLIFSARKRAQAAR
jgi:SAM-dependent methyltransferase